MQSSSGTVRKDGAYSNLYGVRIVGLNTSENKAVSDIVDCTEVATISNVTTSALNGSAGTGGLANANANQLLATDALDNFVSIPYTLSATPTSVPIRGSPNATNFTQLFLTNTSNQITGGVSPNQSTLTAPTPSSGSRIYSLNLQSSTPSFEALSVSQSGAGVLDFTDKTVTVAQIGLKSASNGSAYVNVDSATGNNATLNLQSSGTDIWTLGELGSDGSFLINSVGTGQQVLKIPATGSPSSVLVSADVLPAQSSTISLGSSTSQWNSFGIASGANTTTDVVTFTGTAIIPGVGLGITVNNSNVTTSSIIVCKVFDFSGTYFTNGCPYALTQNVAIGSFNLFVYNLSSTTTIGAGITTLVRYWVFN